MGTERARDPMFKQSPPPAASGSSACGARRASGCKWGARGSVHVHTARSHGCPRRFDSSRLLTSHWVLLLPLQWCWRPVRVLSIYRLTERATRSNGKDHIRIRTFNIRNYPYHIGIRILKVGFLRSKYDDYHYSTHLCIRI
jgi:hypothetical protein